MYHRYQVIVYDFFSGTDEKLGYSTLKDAKKAAIKYLSEYDGSAIFDFKTRKCVALYNDFSLDKFSEDVKRASNPTHYYL